MRRLSSITALAALVFSIAVPRAAAAPKLASAFVGVTRTGEPGVYVDNRTKPPTIYVVAIGDDRASARLWKSMNGGRSFKVMARTEGGGDEDVVVDRKGTVYVSSLFGTGSGNGALAMATSTNGGRSFARTVNVTGNGHSHDRQWVATARARQVVLTVRDLDLGRLVSYVSNDSAETFDGPFDIGPEAIPGPVVHGPRGRYYMAFGSGGAIRFAESTNGEKWTSEVVARGRDSVLFPVIAVDDASNLYVAWSDTSADELRTGPILFSRSRDGIDWSKPQAISPAAPDAFGQVRSAVFPWIVAGSKGRVAISYMVARQAAGPDLSSDFGGPQTTWDVVVAQSTNALSSKPRWTRTTIARSTHTGSICQFGTACLGPPSRIGNLPLPLDRRLLDYFESAIDRSGRIYTAYQRDRSVVSGEPNDAVFSQTDIMLARQIGGTRLRP